MLLNLHITLSSNSFLFIYYSHSYSHLFSIGQELSYLHLQTTEHTQLHFIYGL